MLREARFVNDQELAEAVRRTGYSGTIVPTRLVHLRVKNLSCGGCPTKASEALRAARGTRRAVVDSRAGRASVTIDRRKTDSATLVKVLKRAGFEARIAD